MQKLLLGFSIAALALQATAALSAGVLYSTKDKGVYIYETNRPTVAAARLKALKYCYEHQSNCKPITNWTSGCLSIAHVAKPSTSNISGWAVKKNQSDADVLALRTCNDLDDFYGCVTVVSKCEK